LGDDESWEELSRSLSSLARTLDRCLVVREEEEEEEED
jgi:hypothetical protein